MLYFSGVCEQMVNKNNETTNSDFVILVQRMGLDGLCPSFASRNPDCVRLRRGGSSPFYSIETKNNETTNSDFVILVQRMGLEPT